MALAASIDQRGDTWVGGTMHSTVTIIVAPVLPHIHSLPVA